MAVIERGDHAKQLLSSEFFIELIDHLTTYHVADMAACRPGIKADEDALHYHHTMQHALTEICGTLKEFVEGGEQESARLLRENAENGDIEARRALALEDD